MFLGISNFGLMMASLGLHLTNLCPVSRNVIENPSQAMNFFRWCVSEEVLKALTNWPLAPPPFFKKKQTTKKIYNDNLNEMDNNTWQPIFLDSTFNGPWAEAWKRGGY